MRRQSKALRTLWPGEVQYAAWRLIAVLHFKREVCACSACAHSAPFLIPTRVAVRLPLLYDLNENVPVYTSLATVAAHQPELVRALLKASIVLGFLRLGSRPNPSCALSLGSSALGPSRQRCCLRCVRVHRCFARYISAGEEEA